MRTLSALVLSAIVATASAGAFAATNGSTAPVVKQEQKAGGKHELKQIKTDKTSTTTEVK